jgi:LDH2 family malate/lactate/ureidoglycolate dehydrogenase
VKIKEEEIKHVCIHLLRKRGTSLFVAKKVVEDLVTNERQGYSSHGILRIPEYVQAIDQKNIIPKNTPKIQHIYENSTVIDGKKSFGCLAKEKVISALFLHLEQQGFGFVSLINSGHIGRLQSVVTPISKRGGIVIGFLNFSGAGQNVFPYGGEEGRLCTNPMVFSIPGPNETPIVLDMSTTNVAEGKVREAFLRGQKVPKGWLIDKKWKDVTDPRELYVRPQKAYLSPLGGKTFGHKGFGLALITEILSGILTGGGFASAHSTFFGNSAFFIVLSPKIFGRTHEQFQEELQNLLSYISFCPVADGFSSIKIPGFSEKSNTNSRKETRTIKISKQLWQKINELMC